MRHSGPFDGWPSVFCVCWLRSLEVESNFAGKLAVLLSSRVAVFRDLAKVVSPILYQEGT